MTLRQRIAELLSEGIFTAREIGKELGITEKEILEHLSHIARSRGPRPQLKILPSRCLECNFVFTKRNKLHAPSKCPRCRSERIQPPRFTLKSFQ